MATIKVTKTVRENKSVPDITPNHFIFTKNKDEINIRLDPKMCKFFEDREAFMNNLYEYFTSKEGNLFITDRANDKTLP